MLNLRPKRLYLLVLFGLLGLLNPILAVDAWRGPVLAAIGIPIGVAVIIYMVIHAFHLENYKTMVRDEMVQLGVTALLVGALLVAMPITATAVHQTTCGVLGADKFCDANSNSGDFTLICPFIYDASAQKHTCKNLTADVNPLNAWALNMTTAQGQQLSESLTTMAAYSQALGDISSRSAFCNMVGAGFGVAACSSYGMIRGPLGQMISAGGIGLMDLEAKRVLLSLNLNATLALLLPLGILLRCLHFTRKAGGTLIALALSLYFVFPASLIWGEQMAEQFIVTNAPKDGNGNVIQPAPYGKHILLDPTSLYTTGISPGGIGDVPICDPFQPNENDFLDTFDGWFASGSGGWLATPSPVDQILFYVIVRGLLATAIALIATLSAVRMMGGLLGADVDVNLIARLS